MKYLQVVVILAIFSFLLTLYFSKTLIRKGMTKNEILEVISRNDIILDTFKTSGDTVILSMPNAWFGGNPESTFVLVFDSDTLKSFEKINP